MKQCSKCKMSFDVEHFYRAGRSKDGYMPCCKQCANAASKRSGQKDITRYRRNRSKYRTGLVARALEWKQEQGCQLCSESDGVCLELHHLDPTVKEDHPSAILQRLGWDAFLEEARKCIVLCANCHRKVHAGKISLV